MARAVITLTAKPLAVKNLNHPHTMKRILSILCLAVVAVLASSCTTYVEERGYVATRGYVSARPGPVYYRAPYHSYPHSPSYQNSRYRNVRYDNHGYQPGYTRGRPNHYHSGSGSHIHSGVSMIHR